MFIITRRIGVIGAGLIGSEHIYRIKNRLTDAEIVAISDVDKEKVMNIINKENINADFFESGYELIHSDNVDSVIITTWGETHEEFVMECLKVEKPVFCEKPLATTAEGCKRIIDKEVELQKKLVQVGYMRRFDESYRALKNTLENGEIGDALIVRCAHRIPSHPRNKGDMAITEACVHEIDTMQWLLKDEFITAQVLLPRSTSYVDEGVHDPHIIILETKQGIIVEVEVFINSNYGYDIQCHIVGEQGIAYLPDPPSVVLRKDFQTTNSITKNWKERFDKAYDIELQEWILNLKDEKVEGPTAWDGYMVALTSDACVKAKKTRNRVAVPQIEKPNLYK